MFLTSFSYYRGIAIVLIVIGHCYGLSGWTFASYPERVLANILTGSSVLFVFISGFLFHLCVGAAHQETVSQAQFPVHRLVTPVPGTIGADATGYGPAHPSRQSQESRQQHLLILCLLCGTFSPGRDSHVRAARIASRQALRLGWNRQVVSAGADHALPSLQRPPFSVFLSCLKGARR